MASNVLPSAPEYEETETQTTLYPVLGRVNPHPKNNQISTFVCIKPMKF